MASHADVLVIGAGVIGCAVAHAVAREGASVLVLDAGTPGAGASQASAGVLAPHIEAMPGSILQDLGIASLDLYDAFINTVRNDAGFDVPYAREGTLEVAGSEAGIAHLNDVAARLGVQGVPCELVSGTRLRDLEPLIADDQHVGLLVPVHGTVRVRDLVDALRLAAVHRGARFAQPERVARVRPDGRIFRVDTHSGSHLAQRVVVTSGAWSISLPLEGHPPVPTRPVRGQLLRLYAVGGLLRRVLWGESCYLVPWGDEVLAGATVEDVGFDQRATLEGVTGLALAAQALVPSLAAATFSEVRVGLRPGSPDGLPIIGPSSHWPGLIYSTAHYRNGILLAPLTARIVADVVFNRPEPIPDAVLPARLGL